MRKLLISASLVLCLVSGARADTGAYEKQELVRYQKYASAPVDEFRMVSLFRWQVVGPRNVVAWSTIRKAYLITVDLPCTNLEWTHGLGLTQSQKWTVSKKFDFVAFDDQRCTISRIQPIDLTAMSKDNQPADQAAKPADKS